MPPEEVANFDSRRFRPKYGPSPRHIVLAEAEWESQGRVVEDDDQGSNRRDTLPRASRSAVLTIGARQEPQGFWQEDREQTTRREEVKRVSFLYGERDGAAESATCTGRCCLGMAKPAMT